MSRQDWWQRNWKWLVPTGCLTVLLAFAGFIALIMALVFGMLRSSGAYSEAVELARTNPSVVSALGTPIEAGYFISGSITESGPSGEAEMSIPISGPRGEGMIYVEATKSAGAWEFYKLIVEISATRERVGLLAPTPAGTDLPDTDAEPIDRGAAARDFIRLGKAPDTTTYIDAASVRAVDGFVDATFLLDFNNRPMSEHGIVEYQSALVTTRFSCSERAYAAYRRDEYSEAGAAGERVAQLSRPAPTADFTVAPPRSMSEAMLKAACSTAGEDVPVDSGPVG